MTEGRRLAAGDLIGDKYEIVAELGRGGMAIVYEARHLELGSRVAVKVLRPEFASSTTFVGRFSREARALVRLQSEHVAKVLDVGTLEGSGAPYMVMERLAGRDLRGEIKARGPLAIELAVDWLLQACEAVAEAHARGIVHRDLKPSNLFLARRDDGSHRIKVLDFGIAKAETEHAGDPALTGTQEVFGSPSYMSPEQLRASSHVDARSDVWSLGVVLYELLCGVTPFRGGAVPEVHTAVLAGTVPEMPREDVPLGLRQVIDRCLEKEPDRRFPSVAAMARALLPFAPADADRRIQAIESWAATKSEDGHVTVPHRADYDDTKHTATAPPPPVLASPEPGQQTNTNWDRDPEKRSQQRRWIMIGCALVAAAAMLFALGPRDDAPIARTGVEGAAQPLLAPARAAAPPPPAPPPSATAGAPAATASAAPRPRPPAAAAKPGGRSVYDDRE